MLCMCSSTLKARLFLHNLVWDLELNPRVSVVFLLSRCSSSTLFIPRPVNIHLQVLLKMQVSFVFIYPISSFALLLTLWTTFFPSYLKGSGYSSMIFSRQFSNLHTYIILLWLFCKQFWINLFIYSSVVPLLSKKGILRIGT